MPRDHMAHLGVGWRFPVSVSSGRLSYAAHEEDIEQAIQIVLLTARGERLMLNGFGGGLRDFVFEPNSDATRARIEVAVRKALVDWEPRINVERVEVTSGGDRDRPNLLLIQIDYVVRATNSFYNRVYPFYLLEQGA